ncbi:hypothetical protein BpHYR1_051640 [Brachionus plicatilis]|uniref:Homologous recombination OB-fold protein OB-fold domain-containing protein n=1 Tax=Brachionus plicatilis TaxID=10195 RepID=A0A3M7S0B8_BRAPC|nr:hypothetical protein BpHYR1_051640 [Brachionus plicatilis]
MSLFDSTLHINLSQLNEDDLNLDLDDEDDFKKPSPIDSNNNKNSQPRVPESGKTDLNESIITGHQKALETTLDDLFQGEDEEDFLIRTQPMISSTQATQSTATSPQLIISTQSAGELLKKVHSINETISEASSNSDLTIWHQAQLDLSKRLSHIGMDQNLLNKYTLDFYYKKFFDYSLLRICESGLRKLPLLCLWIKEISRNDRNSNATVTLTDGVESIKGTISKLIASNNWELLHIGSVLLLQNVCLLRVNYAKNGYHLNINQPNLVMVYHKSEKKVQRHEFNEFRSDTIKDLIEHFEKTYVFIDTSLIKMNTSSNKSCLGTSVAKPPRPAPYQFLR